MNQLKLFFVILENAGHDRVHVTKPVTTNVVPRPTPQVVAPPRPTHPNIPANNHRPTPVVSVKRQEQIERATSPVDERILNEFYTDKPKDVHQYSLEGRQYVVYEGAHLTDIDTYRKGK